MRLSKFRNINIFRFNYFGKEKFLFTTLNAPEEQNIGRTGYFPYRQRRNREGSTKMLGSMRRKFKE